MRKIKADFPIFKQLEQGHPLCYLDSASTSQKPQAMLDVLMNFYAKHNANVGRGIYHLAEEATALYQGARATIAQFINAKHNEIIFTKNSTEGINLIAMAWAREHIKAGDEILLSELEHHSNLVPWQWVAQQTGAALKFIPIDEHGLLIMDQLGSLITQRTKLIAITHSSNAIGTQVDVQQIIQQGHAVGAKVLVDACQSVPHATIDVQKMNPDFLVFAGHKMLAPTGIGVLYINESLHDEVVPFMRGGGTIFEAQWQETTFGKAPHKYEGGTPPIAQAIGLGAAIRYLQTRIQFDDLIAHEAKLCTQLIDGLQEHRRIRILGPIDQLRERGHLVSFVVDGIHAHDVSAFLDTRGICVRAGHFCAQPLLAKLGVQSAVRASFYLYNDAEDVVRLLEGIDAMLKNGKGY